MNNVSSVENVHLQFCKTLLGVRRQTMNKFVYGETGRTPIYYNLIVRVIKYWFKILKSAEINYVKQVYEVLVEDLHRYPQRRTWAAQVKYILQSYGFNHVWIAQGARDINILKQRIYDNYLQTWNSQNDQSSRNEFYQLFSSFGCKPYLNSINNKTFRCNLARFRMSTHSLAVESGRWHKPNKIPRTDRKCFLCEDIEDEYHFLLVCPLYKDLREQYLKRVYWLRPSMFKCFNLMKTENAIVVRQM